MTSKESRPSLECIPALEVPPDLEAVRRFWNACPLFAGESCHRPGEKAFFEEHEQTILYEYGGTIDPIFTRDVTPTSKVLDVGCGIGFWVQQFCQRNARVTACDLSETAVQLTCRRVELFGLVVHIQQGNAEQLPYADDSFDHVNSQGVIHHTPDTQRCLQEFHRVLKPGGTLCFSVYYKPWMLRSRVLFKTLVSLMRPWVQLRGRGRETMLWASEPEELVRLYDGAHNPIGKAFTRADIDTLLTGWFYVLEEKYLGFPRRVFPVPIPRHLHRCVNRMCSLMIVLRCRKL